MKKVLLFAIILGGAVAFTSCSKRSDYKCDCTSPTLTSSTTYTDYKEEDAEAGCDSEKSTYTALGGSCTFSEI